MSNETLLDTLNQLPDLPLTDDEINAVLREGGLDPEQVRRNGKAFVERELAALIDERVTARAELSALRDDYTALGEALEASKALVGTLYAELATATAQIAALSNDLATATQSLAIERRNVQLVSSLLQDSHGENEQLHAELSKARQTKTTWTTWMDAPPADARDSLEQMAYPDAELAREAGVSEEMGEGEGE